MTLLSLVGAAGALVFAATLLKPASPPPESKSPDMTVEKSAISVREQAPQWKFLKLATVGEVGSHWTDLVPGRISIDESLSSKVGVPVEGPYKPEHYRY